MTEKLKPCPFYGGCNLSSGGDAAIVGVWCRDCQAVGPNHYGRHEWNTRAAPKVKPLVWEGDGYWCIGDNDGWMEEANTTFEWGYSIEFGAGISFKADSSFGWSQDGFETPDDAKAAAQADYERRIMEALE